MNTIKRSLALTVLLFAALGLSAQTGGTDFGLSLENSSTLSYTNDSLDLNQGNTAKLFYIWEDGPWSARFQGSVAWQFAMNQNLSVVSGNQLVFDFSNASLSANLPMSGGGLTSLGFQAGRFNFSDPLRLVLNQTLDGLGLWVNGDTLDFAFYAGYNGFIFRDSSQLNFTPSDIADLQNTSQLFAAPRVVGKLDLKIKNETGSSVLGLSVIGQGDLRGFISPEKIIEIGNAEPTGDEEGGLYHSLHSLLFYQAQPGSQWFLEFAGALQTGLSMVLTSDDGYQDIPILAGGAFGKLIFFPNAMNRFSLLGGWTSGDNNSRDLYDEGSPYAGNPTFLTLFKGLSSPGLGAHFAPSLGNISWVEFQWNLRPAPQSYSVLARNFSSNLRVLGFFRSGQGPTSSSRVLADSANPYIGSEINLGFSLRPFSDLGLNLNSALFLPASFEGGAMEGNASTVEGRVSAFLSLRI